MDKNRIRELLESNGYEIDYEQRYKNYAWRFKLKNGTSVFCGDRNIIWAKGKNKDAVIEYLNTFPIAINNRVFVVYGRDHNAKKELVEMLQEWGIEPLVFDALPVRGMTVIEKLEHYIPQANYGIVLATPDDIGYLVGCESEAKYRARQNVVLELGMLLSKLGRSRVAIILKKNEKFEDPSDIKGMGYLRFDNSITEIKNRLKDELNAQGYEIE